MFFCPVCHSEIAERDPCCPVCGADVTAELGRPYVDRLVRALENPLSEVRMGSIIALGMRGDTAAASALAECAFRHPTDIVEGLAIVHALQHLPDSVSRKMALVRLARHPAHAVRQAVRVFIQAHA
ncbi:MAG: HEAT repeat domain-containing protein [Gammaproteobacteria bacterium]